LNSIPDDNDDNDDNEEEEKEEEDKGKHAHLLLPGGLQDDRKQGKCDHRK